MYQHILFSVKFGFRIDSIAKKIKEIVKKFNSKLTLIHVVEMPRIDPIPEIVRAEPLFIRQAQKQLAQVGDLLNLPIQSQCIEIGDPKIIIPNFVEKEKIDLLMLGYHERHGISQIVGSTAYTLLLHSKCDVLTIR